MSHTSTVTHAAEPSTGETSALRLRGSFPAINGTRLNETLHESCQWGCTPDGGMNRLALNDDDAKVRRWFIEQVDKLGCEVTIDSMGNMFAVMNSELGGPPIAMGSHLDTQPTGGRYDGILGVQAGLEVLRTVKESGYKTKHPLAVIVWTDEEGSRFIPSMLGSAVWSGFKSIDFGHAVQDMDGVSLKSELERHGFLGDTPSSHKAIPLKAHFEVHIEQGPILDEADAPVSVVAGVQGCNWLEIKVQGRGSHAGTTPMSYRHDPLVAFTQMAQVVESVANRHGGLGTIGRIFSESPQSTNCVLDDIVFHLDIRHHDDKALEAMHADVKKAFHEIADKAQGVRIERWKLLTAYPALKFDDLAVSCVREACQGYPKFELISGAGHDSVHTAKHCPTAMIFIRCKDGISHHPSEYSSPEDITIGTKVLLESVLSYDARVD